VAIDGVRWDSGGTESRDCYTFFCGKGSYQLGPGFVIHKGVASAIQESKDC
jgi:hypothetical protein